MNPNTGSQRLFQNLLAYSQNDNLIHPLTWAGFDAASHTMRLDCLTTALADFVGSMPDEIYLRILAPGSLRVIAQRLLLGGLPAVVRRLARLWQANGTPPQVIDLAVDAAELRAAWKGGIMSSETPLWNGRGHAAFVELLGRIEGQDPRGPLGEAVRWSRYHGAAGRDGPALPGEYRWPAGFPVVLGAHPDLLREAAWVWPGQPTITAEGGTDQNCPALVESWRAVGQKLGPFAPKQIPQLPPWLHAYAGAAGVDALSSAELSLALEGLALHNAWPLPAGVGFTGQTMAGSDKDLTLEGVTGLTAKLQAARESGIFVLFACCEMSEVPPEEEVARTGVMLVPLAPGLTLAELAPVVNSACYRLGLTEYRWEWESQQLCRNAVSETTITSPPLPLATRREACPVGIIGRRQVLKQLRDWKVDGGQEDDRHFLTLVASARSGKTTLLAHWLQTDSVSWPRFPVWYSFRRHTSGHNRLDDLRLALERQLRARFLVLPSRPLREGESKSVIWSDLARTEADVVVDGLDEALQDHQSEALDFLLGLPGRGCVVIGSQNISALRCTNARRVRMEDRPQEGHEDAVALVDAFARHFCDVPDECVQKLGRLLGEPDWQEGLAARAGDNLWILTDFLRPFLEEADAAGWPERPEDLRLTNNVRDYCCDRITQILDAYPTPSERDEVEALLTCLAVLEDRPWVIEDVLTLMGIIGGPVQTTRWRRLLRQEVARLVVVHGELVRLRDGTFGQFLLEDRSDVARSLARTVVGLLVSETRRLSPSLRTYAIRRAARHLLRDGLSEPHLAAQLLVDSGWARARFLTLAEGEDNANDYLSELVALEGLANRHRPEELAPVRALRAAVGAWHWAIEQTQLRLQDGSGRCLADWWARLRPADAPSVWAMTPTPGPPSGKARLLWPLGHDWGLSSDGSPSALPLSLGGLACEMIGREGPHTLVLVDQTGDLVVAGYDAESGGYTQLRRLFLGVRAVHQLHALNPTEVLILADDWSGRPRLLCVDIVSGTSREYWTAPTDRIEDIAGFPSSVAVLSPGTAGRPERVLVALSQGSRSRLVLLEAGQGTGFGADLEYRHPRVVVFAPDTWAVLEGPPSYRRRCTFQALARQQVVSLKEYDPDEEWPDSFVESACPLPGNRLVMAAVDTELNGELLIFSALGELLGTYPISDEDYGCCVPVGWCEGLGLILADLDLGGMEARALEDDHQRIDLNQELYAQVGRHLDCEGGVGLSDGRALLVFFSGGLVLERGGQGSIPVGNLDRLMNDVQILGVHEEGWLLVGEPVRRGDTLIETYIKPTTPEEWEQLRQEVEKWEQLQQEAEEWDQLRQEAPVGVVETDESNKEIDGPVQMGERENWLESLRSRYHHLRYVAPSQNNWGNPPDAVPPFEGAHFPGDSTFLLLGKDDRHSPLLAGLNLGHEPLACYADCGDFVVVGYKSRRIEIHSRRASSSGRPAVLALAFTRFPPTSLIVCRRGRETYLAVLAEELLWFDLTSLAVQ